MRHGVAIRETLRALDLLFGHARFHPDLCADARVEQLVEGRRWHHLDRDAITRLVANRPGVLWSTSAFDVTQRRAKRLRHVHERADATEELLPALGAVRVVTLGSTRGRVPLLGHGERVGDHLRRGQILIEGNAGDYLGSRMWAGTIAVMGQTGRYAGYAMRRGTLLFWQQPQLPATFNDCGSHTLSFLPLLFKSFKNLDSRFADTSLAFNRVRRYGGDLAATGRGEVLVKL